MKTDYTTELKSFLEDHFEPIESVNDQSEYTEQKTLDQVYAEVTNILPSNFIHQTDVYDMMKELGFKSFRIHFPEKRNNKGKIVQREFYAFRYLMDRKTAAI